MILMLAPGIGWLLLSVTIPEIEFCAKLKQKTMKVNTPLIICCIKVAKLQIF
jgi:hypothetical protein